MDHMVDHMRHCRPPRMAVLHLNKKMIMMTKRTIIRAVSCPGAAGGVAVAGSDIFSILFYWVRVGFVGSRAGWVVGCPTNHHQN